MGHREDLLAGAKACLLKIGYARTTARDIVAASGANLGSIGYHFGSKEALLNAALVQATEEWSDELERALTTTKIASEANRMERFEILWGRVIDLFQTHKALWAAQFEMFTQIQHKPEMRPRVAEAQEQARRGLAALLQQVDPSYDEKSARVAASFFLSLMTGVMAQLLADPDGAPSAHDLTEAVRLMAMTTATPEVPAPGLS
ncbi:TetR/AcrR family transcriptional regulator [Streptomyces sp. NPDC046203]|uniref:TetR/AcrR family transcriptional regulator n=1 Tax=Streptomyces sp. NPDC046203 TaxID=3154602 RepID=UPI0033F61FA2